MVCHQLLKQRTDASVWQISEVIQFRSKAYIPDIHHIIKKQSHTCRSKSFSTHSQGQYVPNDLHVDKKAYFMIDLDTISLAAITQHISTLNTIKVSQILNMCTTYRKIFLRCQHWTDMIAPCASKRGVGSRQPCPRGMTVVTEEIEEFCDDCSH